MEIKTMVQEDAINESLLSLEPITESVSSSIHAQALLAQFVKDGIEGATNAPPRQGITGEGTAGSVERLTIRSGEIERVCAQTQALSMIVKQRGNLGALRGKAGGLMQRTRKGERSSRWYIAGGSRLKGFGMSSEASAVFLGGTIGMTRARGRLGPSGDNAPRVTSDPDLFLATAF